MKRVWINIIIILVIFIISNDTNDSSELRFRIIGNSNSVIDQNLKMKVARELQTIKISKNNLDITKKKTEYIVLSNNFTYEVNVCIRNEVILLAKIQYINYHKEKLNFNQSQQKTSDENE